MKGIRPLTGKQKQAFDFINAFIRERGYAPSLKEIAKYIGRNLSTAQYFVKELEEKGYLRKSARQARGIQLISNSHHVYLLGYIAAGEPIEPVENPEKITVPENIKIDTRYPHYALKVKGDSMIDMGIIDNDVVLIRHQIIAKNGDVVVAITEKGATLKVFKRKNGSIYLEPRNKKYPTIIPKHLEIRGKLVGLIRSN